jgi:hypothetical protein
VLLVGYSTGLVVGKAGLVLLPVAYSTGLEVG